MKLPDVSHIRVNPESEVLVSLVQEIEQALSLRQVDNRHVTRRRLNSRHFHLGTTDLIQAGKEELKDFYLHLTRIYLGGL